MKMKLRLWVKVTLIVVVGVAVIVGFNKFNEKEINNCVDAGNTIEYCKRGL